MTNIFLFAGETSADLYGGLLLAQLKKMLPDASFWGVGGPNMQAHGFQAFIDMQAFQVMGFSDVLLALPRLTKNFLKIKKAILEERPAVVVCIDQPSFGIRLAKALRKAGFAGKIVQFVAPTVWAYKPQRADIMAKYFDVLLTLFDFEAKYFAHTPLKTVFVGHPIIELIENEPPQPLELEPNKPILSLFPGSRPSEVQRNLKKQLQAALLFQQKHPQFQIAIVAKEPIKGISPEIIQIPFSARYELMKKSTFAISKSGTVTLELAQHLVPTVVTYELSKLNYLIAKYVLKLRMPYYSIANILWQKELFFEQIYPPVTPQSICACLEIWQNDPQKCQEVKTACLELQRRLKPEVSPSKKVAEVICGLI